MRLLADAVFDAAARYPVLVAGQSPVVWREVSWPVQDTEEIVEQALFDWAEAEGGWLAD